MIRTIRACAARALGRLADALDPSSVHRNLECITASVELTATAGMALEERVSRLESELRALKDPAVHA